MINGSNLAFSDVAGAVAMSQLPSVALTTTTVPKSGGSFTGDVHFGDGLTMPSASIIGRTQTPGGDLEYCKSRGCLLGCTPSSNNDQSAAGTKTFTDSQPIKLSAPTSSKVLALDGSKSIIITDNNLVTAAELAKI